MHLQFKSVELSKVTPSVVVGSAEEMDEVLDAMIDPVTEAAVDLAGDVDEAVAAASRVPVRVVEVTAVAELSCLLTGTT